MTDITLPIAVEVDQYDTLTLRVYQAGSTWSGVLVGSDGFELGDIARGCASPAAVEEIARESGIYPDHVEVETE